MNNKGFAITGILYTLFILFTMILLSVLATMSAKRTSLEKTIIGLENSYKLKEVAALNFAFDNNKVFNNNTVFINNGIAIIDGKYEFILNTNTEIGTIKCVAYLKKGNKIPNEVNPADELFSPRDCNTINYPISLKLDDTGTNKLILKKIYIYLKDSEVYEEN